MLALGLACRGADADDTPHGGRAAAPGKSPASLAAGEIVIGAPKVPYAVANTASAGSVTGNVSLRSAISPLAPIPTGANSALCGAEIADESVVQQAGGVGNVVVWLDGIRSGKRPPLERRLELENDHCKLGPRVQAAMSGSAVNVIGHDDIRQHLRFVAAGDEAPRAAILLGGGEQVIPTELPFLTPGLVVVSDVDHAWPRAYLAVFDHPYYAVTDANGAFTIDGVPPGRYTLHAWHERTKVAQQTVDVGAGPTKVSVALDAK
jgi:hypothetical protein